MKIISFQRQKINELRKEVLDSGACLVEFKEGGSRKVVATCLLLDVSGLTLGGVHFLSDQIVGDIKVAMGDL